MKGEWTRWRRWKYDHTPWIDKWSGTNLILEFLFCRNEHTCEKINDKVSGGDLRIKSFKCKKCHAFLGQYWYYVDDNEVSHLSSDTASKSCECFK